MSGKTLLITILCDKDRLPALIDAGKNSEAAELYVLNWLPPDEINILIDSWKERIFVYSPSLKEAFSPLSFISDFFKIVPTDSFVAFVLKPGAFSARWEEDLAQLKEDLKDKEFYTGLPHSEGLKGRLPAMKTLWFQNHFEVFRSLNKAPIPLVSSEFLAGPAIFFKEINWQPSLFFQGLDMYLALEACRLNYSPAYPEKLPFTSHSGPVVFRQFSGIRTFYEQMNCEKFLKKLSLHPQHGPVLRTWRKLSE